MMFRTYMGDCIEVMRNAKAESVHAVVCDPPYGIEFMGKSWDSPQRMVGQSTGVNGGFQDIGAGVPRPEMAKTDPYLFQQWSCAWATEALRVLKPGGHLLAFGGDRTFHRLCSGIEDASFEMRGLAIWVTAQGFPKAKKIEGHDGWKTACLKPAFEPIAIARKPMSIPGARPGTTRKASTKQNMDVHGVGGFNIDATRIGDVVMVNPPGMKGWNGYRHEGDYQDTDAVAPTVSEGRFPANLMLDGDLAEALEDIAKFFFVSKAKYADRYLADGTKNPHPTVKPTDLMRHLIRLVTPVGGLVLDPFMGSGSTGVAARLEQCRFVGIEIDEIYHDIARRRIAEASA